MKIGCDYVVSSNETSIRIIEVATKHFLEFGYKNTFLSKIAEDAKVGRRTVYRYFENKDNLVVAIMSSFYDDFSRKLNNIDFNKEKSAYKKIERLFDFYFEYMGSNTDFLFFSNMVDSNIFQDHGKQDLYTKYLASTNAADDLLHVLIEEGQKDHSIDEIENTYITAVTINNVLINLATSMFRSSQVSVQVDVSMSILRQMIMKYIKS